MPDNYKARKGVSGKLRDCRELPTFHLPAFTCRHSAEEGHRLIPHEGAELSPEDWWGTWKVPPTDLDPAVSGVGQDIPQVPSS